MQTPSAYSPLSLGSLNLKNRIALAPMTRARSGKDRIPNDLMAEYYLQRAGAGLILTEATCVDPAGLGWQDTPGIYTDEMTEGWKKTVKAVHGEGGVIFLQLWHCGRASHSDFLGGELPVSASAVKLEGDPIHTPQGKKDYEVPRPLELSEISGVISAYRQAARRAKEAGFDGVEVHSANGYLLNQFLDSRSNQRTDEYGGSVENRFRLLREVLEAVLEELPADRVSVRLSPNGAFNDMGADDYRETFLYAATELDRYGLAFLHIMDGLAFGFHERGTPMTLTEFREIIQTPLMGNCGYDREATEKAIASGEADLISIGRPYLSNPDLVARWENGWPEAPVSDMSTWYTPAGAEGYTDFPAYSPES